MESSRDKKLREEASCEPPREMSCRSQAPAASESSKSFLRKGPKLSSIFSSITDTHRVLESVSLPGFDDVDQAEALKFALQGECVGLRHFSALRSFWWRGPLGAFMETCRPLRARFLVVVDADEGAIVELRWDPDVTKASSPKAEGRLSLRNVRYVAPTFVSEDESCLHNTGKNKAYAWEFRIVSSEETLKIRASSRASMKLWVTALRRLVRKCQGSVIRPLRSDTRTGSPGLKETPCQTVEEVMEYMKEQGVPYSYDYKHFVCESLGLQGRPITGEDALDLVYVLSVKDTLLPYFDQYADKYCKRAWPNTSSRCMSVQSLDEFLYKEQGEHFFFGPFPAAASLVARMRQPFAVEATDSGEHCLSLMGFSYLMTCAENAAFDPSRRVRVQQDMSRPLSHYWIASSHNTYLEDHQLVGRSSLEQYIDVLLRGCRCVEIDIWDGEGREPMVTHGWTATSRLRLTDVACIIRDYGFVASPYPLILSLEIRCGPKFRERTVQIFQDILRDRLLMHLDDEDEICPALISPEAAKGKVIIKAKTILFNFGLDSGKQPETPSTPGLTPRISGLTPRWGSSNQGTPTRFGSTFASFHFGGREVVDQARFPHQDSGQTSDATSCDSQNSVAFGTPPKMIYLPNLKLKGIFNRARRWLPARSCVSFSEVAATRAMVDVGLETLRDHHRIWLSRVYPAASRVDSTNFDPMPMWHAGFQLVALNYQSYDLPMHLNEGLFSNENGNSGYVLKPASVRGSSVMAQLSSIETSGSDGFDTPSDDSSNETRKMERLPSARWDEQFASLSPRSSQDDADADGAGLECSLELTVLSAHSLPKVSASVFRKSQMDLFIRVRVCGMPEDCAVVETGKVQANGFNPQWCERFVFQVKNPTLAMMAFEVINYKAGSNGFVVAAAFPLIGVREGVRWVSLWDRSYMRNEHCGLLLKVRLSGPWGDLRRQQILEKEYPMPTRPWDKDVSAPSILTVPRPEVSYETEVASVILDEREDQGSFLADEKNKENPWISEEVASVIVNLVERRSKTKERSVMGILEDRSLSAEERSLSKGPGPWGKEERSRTKEECVGHGQAALEFFVQQKVGRSRRSERPFQSILGRKDRPPSGKISL